MMMPNATVRIREFVITKKNWIFAVVSYDNDAFIEGFLRYVPDKNGCRVRQDGKRFRKVDFDEARQLMQKSYAYVDGMCAIPYEDVVELKHPQQGIKAVSYTHLRAHETVLDLVCRLLLEKKKK